MTPPDLRDDVGAADVPVAERWPSEMRRPAPAAGLILGAACVPGGAHWFGDGNRCLCGVTEKPVIMARSAFTALQTELDAMTRERDRLRDRLALAAGREEIYRVAIEHIWDEDTPPDYAEHDTGDEQAPSTGCIWAWHALGAVADLEVRMGAAPDFEHQRRLRNERIRSGGNWRRAAWPFPPRPTEDGDE